MVKLIYFIQKQVLKVAQHVNDRPYITLSFLSVANPQGQAVNGIAQVFCTVLAGRSKDKPELVETALLLTTKLAGVQKAAEVFTVSTRCTS